MLFNSYEFAFFLPITFIIYWLLGKDLRLQNIFLVVSSFVFYGWWSIYFLGLMILSASTDYIVGILLSKNEDKRRRKMLLFASIAVNLSILFFFKYFNFFVDNFVSAFTLLGKSFDKPTLNVILPVGISFYTFQAMSYTIDVYKRTIEPTRDPIVYFAFISFFPQLVAGPIERAGHMLKQFTSPRKFDFIIGADGMRLILSGLFKKVVIADNCAPYVNDVFQNYANMTPDQLMVGIFLFTVQIYCDFSGYSEMAMGTAKLFGFSLMRNFHYPYFSRDIAEFWRRWHISLTTWFRDYIYIPLGGSRVSRLLQVRNIFIVFLLSGFWHGANWTFVAWGAWNALWFLPLMLVKKNRSHLDIVAMHRWLPTPIEFIKIIFTFCIVMLGWVFFRAANMHDAFSIFFQLFTGIASTPVTLIRAIQNIIGMPVFVFIMFMFLAEWIQRSRLHMLDFHGIRFPLPARYALYCAMLFVLVWYSGKPQQFIYFQF